MSTWDETFRNVLQGIGAINGLIILTLFMVYMMRKARQKGQSEFLDLFLSRRRRVEKRFLVYRGKHYPRRTVRATVRRWLPTLRHKKERL